METRNNLIYPGMLILFIGLRRIVEILIDNLFESVGTLSLNFIISISKFIAGLIAMQNLTFIFKSNLEISSTDNIPKIIVLMFFASYFDFIGTIVRKYFNMSDKENKSLEERLKGFQIISSALLCYFTIRTKMYKQNIFSLMIISICLIIIIIIEMFYSKDRLSNTKNIFLTLFSSFMRANLDTIEKYLFEFNYMNPFKVMMFEGLINIIFISIIIIFNDYALLEISQIFEKSLNLELFFFLMFIYLILSGLKNIYRVATIKYIIKY